MTLVKCPECEIRFDRDKEESQKIGNRWYHTECVIALRERNVEAKNKEPRHVDMTSKGDKKDYKELIDYICKIYEMSRPSGQMLKQIKSFKDEYEYTYKGMEVALRFFYDIENNAVKDDTGVGIIPYIYERAKNYYMRKLEIENTEIDTEVEVRHFKPRKKDYRRFGRQDIDINDL